VFQYQVLLQIQLQMQILELDSNTMTSVIALATSAGNYSLNAGEVAGLALEHLAETLL
jgi:hypothetical protein